MMKTIPSILLLRVEHPQICVDSSTLEMAEQGWTHHNIVCQTEAPFGQPPKTHVGLRSPETIYISRAEAISVSGAVNESFFEHRLLLLSIVMAEATQRLNSEYSSRWFSCLANL